MPENGEKITGTVEATSAYGIKVHGVWCNPHGKAKEYLASAKNGTTVEMTMTGHKNDFSFIQVSSEPVEEQKPSAPPIVPQATAPKATAPKGTPTGYWERKEERDLRGDIRISRHGAINTAVGILGTLKENALAKEMRTYMIKATTMADYVQRYVQDDKDLLGDLIDLPKKESDEAIPEEDVA